MEIVINFIFLCLSVAAITFILMVAVAYDMSSTIGDSINIKIKDEQDN